MKKILLLLLMTFLLTGCDAVYNMEIKNGRLIESTEFYASENDNISTDPSSVGSGKSMEEIVDNYYNNDYLAFYQDTKETAFYQKKKVSYEDRLGLQLNYTYSPASYPYSSLVNYCFDKVSMGKEKGYYVIDLEDSTKCFSQDIYQTLNSVQIHITADDVLESNADEVSDNVYSWTLDQENSNKSIYLKAKIKDGLSGFSIFIICLVCGLASFVTVYLCMDKDKKRDKIKRRKF